MNNEAINKRIQELETKLAGLKAELAKPEKFEFKYEKYKTCFIAETKTLVGCTGEQSDGLENFRYRQTIINAKADFQLQKELMCIGAIAEQLDPDYKSKIDWSNQKDKASIIYCTVTKSYKIAFSNASKALGAVYMDKTLAVQVCKILNEKQVDL